MNNYKNNTFLLIIKDEYLRKINTNDDYRFSFNRENLIEYFLKYLIKDTIKSKSEVKFEKFRFF